METKYTHGPWGWQSFGSGLFLTAQHGMREIILSSARKGMNGSEITMNKDGILEPIDPNHPNAKLIAAAPMLLKACIEARELLIDELCEPERTVFWNLVNAIKKATE